MKEKTKARILSIEARLEQVEHDGEEDCKDAIRDMKAAEARIAALEAQVSTLMKDRRLGFNFAEPMPAPKTPVSLLAKGFDWSTISTGFFGDDLADFKSAPKYAPLDWRKLPPRDGMPITLKSLTRFPPRKPATGPFIGADARRIMLIYPNAIFERTSDGTRFRYVRPHRGGSGFEYSINGGPWTGGNNDFEISNAADAYFPCYKADRLYLRIDTLTARPEVGKPVSAREAIRDMIKHPGTEYTSLNSGGRWAFIDGRLSYLCVRWIASVELEASHLSPCVAEDGGLQFRRCADVTAVRPAVGKVVSFETAKEDMLKYPTARYSPSADTHATFGACRDEVYVTACSSKDSGAGWISWHQRGTNHTWTRAGLRRIEDATDSVAILEAAHYAKHNKPTQLELKTRAARTVPR